MNRFKNLPAAIAMTVAAIIATGCGGGSSSSSNTPAATPPADDAISSTSYSIAVSAPSSLISAVHTTLPQQLQHWLTTPAYALDGGDLKIENFAVTVVDTAGNVVEVVELTEENISKNPDGTWEISVPGDPRLDCLIVVDIDSPISISVGDTLPADALFTPTTTADLAVDIASTAAYQNFLETLDDESSFAAQGFEAGDTAALSAVETLIADVQESYQELIDEGLSPDSFSSVEDLLAQIDTAVEAMVQVAIDDVQNQVPDATLADLFTSGGSGLFWYDFEQEGSDFIFEKGQLAAPNTDTFYELDTTTFDSDGWGPAQSYSGTPDDDLILSADGWQQSADYVSSTANDDGSVALTDMAIDSMLHTLTATSIVDLEGLNILARTNINNQTALLADALSDTAVFSAGARAYKVTTVSVNAIYSLWFEAPDAGECWGQTPPASIAGNCERAHLAGFNSQSAVTTLSDLPSASAGTIEEGDISGVAISWSDSSVIIAELVADNSANFYRYSWSGSSFTSLASGSWAQVTVMGEEIITLAIPTAVRDAADLDDDESTFIFAVQNGLVRLGNYNAPGDVVNTETVYNQQADTDLTGAINAVDLDQLGSDNDI